MTKLSGSVHGIAWNWRVTWQMRYFKWIKFIVSFLEMFKELLCYLNGI